MNTIRVMYTHDEGTWMADSPDFEALSETRLFAGGDSYEEAREQVSGVMPWALDERDDIVLEHFVHEDSLAALAAERQAATPAPVAAAKR